MNAENEIDVVAWCSKIIYQKDDFKIAIFTDAKNGATYKIKGEMFANEKKKYKVKAELDVGNTKYGDTYNAISIAYDIDLRAADPKSLEVFFSTITSARISKNLSQIPNIIDILEEGDVVALTSIEGVGVATADRLISLYFSQKDFSEAYIYFGSFGFTKEAIVKICKYLGGVHKSIEITRENPYSLTKVPGFGFKKVDSAYLVMCRNLKVPIDNSLRFKGYIKHLFQEEFSNGNTWVTPMDLVSKVQEFVPSVSVHDIVEFINSDENYYTLENDNEQFGKIGKRITTKSNLLLEMEIAKELRRIAISKSRMDIKNTEEIIKETEDEQGWKYSSEQRNAIDVILKNNICIIQGAGGTGKTSSVNAYVNILKRNFYMFEQCALSGKAANNLSLVTSVRGSTIHSLIKYGTHDQYNEKHPLPVDVVILDEISMVEARIFLALLKAIPKGGKLIMLGDNGQLDSIGVGVLNGMIRSKAIPSITLKKIHRQAENSAIITHSLKFRKGELPDELKMKTFSENIYGKNQDLKYILVKKDEESEIPRLVMEEFKRLVNIYGVDETQIICSTKTTGVSTAKLNSYAQIIANPESSAKKEILVKTDGEEYILREGDKVMNVTNNRLTTNLEGKITPIFNGNTGVLEIINDANELIIDFDGIGKVVVPEKFFKSIKLGYAATTHKMQGSTIKAVILALPYHFLLNSRELVYTGVTRASKYQTVVTSPRTLRAALKQTSKRVEKTNLDMFIRELNVWKEKLKL